MRYVLVVALAVWGCDDGGGDGGSDAAGQGGAGAAAGQGGQGGAAGQGGQGGAAGQGGQGGAAGQGGQGGAAGQGGQGGVGGQGGQGGVGGQGGGEGDPLFCQEACAEDTDCPDNFVCNNQRCWPVLDGCVGDDHEPCQALFSGWIQPCGSEGDDPCPMGQLCVNANGVGRCAIQPNEQFMCSVIGMEDTQQAAFPDGGEVTVCKNLKARCVDDQCTVPCAGDADCLSPEYPSCDVESGRCLCTANSCTTNASVCGDDGICRCAGDEDCAMAANAPTCLDTGFCGCSANEHCAEGNVDTCYDGLCGCSTVDICPEAMGPGTTPVCEPFRLPE